MPSFSQRSRDHLDTCDLRLQKLFNKVIEHRDCQILCGHRTKEEQDDAVATYRSHAPWPTSNHNKSPSMAVDVMPYPVDWTDKVALKNFSEFVKGCAAGMGISVRWGGDFHNFFDGPHWEIVDGD